MKHKMVEIAQRFSWSTQLSPFRSIYRSTYRRVLLKCAAQKELPSRTVKKKDAVN